MERPVTRSVKLARDVREYHAARAARSAAIARRGAAAQRRSLAMILGVVALAVVGILAGTAVVGWGWMLVPGLSMAGILGLGMAQAKRGAREDAQLRARVRQAEEKLSRTPAGRKALHGSRPTPSQLRWAKVAAGEDGAHTAKPEAAAKGDTEAVLAGDETAARSQVEPEAETVREPREEAEKPGEAELEAETKAREEREAKAWTPVPVPPPTYTLRASAPARATAPLEDEQYATARVPMRPKQAAYLPAGAALSAEEIAAAVPVDLEQILERRRAAGA